MNGSPIQPGRRVETNRALQAQADEAARKLSAQARNQTSANRFGKLTVDAATAANKARFDRIKAQLQ